MCKKREFDRPVPGDENCHYIGLSSWRTKLIVIVNRDDIRWADSRVWLPDWRWNDWHCIFHQFDLRLIWLFWAILIADLQWVCTICNWAEFFRCAGFIGTTACIARRSFNQFRSVQHVRRLSIVLLEAIRPYDWFDGQLTMLQYFFAQRAQCFQGDLRYGSRWPGQKLFRLKIQ